MVRVKSILICLLAISASATAEVIDIDNATLSKLLEQGVPIVDIRTATEWRQTGIVEGAHLLTFFDEAGRYDAAAWLEALGTVAEPDEPVILICRTGNRTAPVAAFLGQRVGYRKVYNVRQGIVRWIAEGRATVRPPQKPS